MKLTQHETVAEFLEAAGGGLEAEESLNNLILGITWNLTNGRYAGTAPPVLMTVAGSGGLEAAMAMTNPPQIVLLYAPGQDAQQTLAQVADALLARGTEVRGCMAPVATVKAFTNLWTQRTGRKATLHKALRIHELRRVLPLASVPGRLRVATMGDVDLAADWRHRFNLEAIGESDAAGARSAVERNIAAGDLFFWDDGGRPVCQAVAARRTRKGISIGAVYTPPEFRSRGYATACVAALSQHQLDAGCQFCCLYTDLANPTSNSIYRNIGYVPVADADEYRFDG